MERGKLILTALWWVWGLLLFALLIALSKNPLFGSQLRTAWEWFVPNLVPTMSMVGATAYASRSGKAVGGPVLTPAFVICLVASVAHLGALTLALLATQSSTTPLGDLRNANLWLGPLQALAVSSLSVFFLKVPEKDKK